MPLSKNWIELNYDKSEIWVHDNSYHPHQYKYFNLEFQPNSLCSNTVKRKFYSYFQVSEIYVLQYEPHAYTVACELYAAPAEGWIS
jgi:hypothetical protein